MMIKTKVAMAISIAGVLAAGSAAALVNTQVLSGSSTPSFVSVADAPRSQLPAPSSTEVAAASTPTVTSAAGVAAAPAPVGSTTQAVYAIGGSGNVTLDTAGDVLTIVAVTPADGWTVTKSEMHQPTGAEVKFQSGTTEVDFRANLLLGVVTTSVESHDDSSTNTSVDAGGTQHGSDDHGGDDD